MEKKEFYFIDKCNSNLFGKIVLNKNSESEDINAYDYKKMVKNIKSIISKTNHIPIKNLKLISKEEYNQLLPENIT